MNILPDHGLMPLGWCSPSFWVGLPGDQPTSRYVQWVEYSLMGKRHEDACYNMAAEAVLLGGGW